jgi:hypothetical protein
LLQPLDLHFGLRLMLLECGAKLVGARSFGHLGQSFVDGRDVGSNDSSVRTIAPIADDLLLAQGELGWRAAVGKARHRSVILKEVRYAAGQRYPAAYDREIASAVAQHTNPAFEQAAQALTWGADEHILITAAVAFWLLSRRGSEQTRITGTHLLATSVVTGILPHALKHIFNQRRPDRLTAIGHLHGIPLSGHPNDAFPSGHAVHMGALASAASAFPKPYRKLTWERHDRTLADENRRTRALEQRCCRGLCRRSPSRTARQALDRLW